MTFTTLASFSLLALVVTARPLLPEPNEAPHVDVPTLDVTSTVQSVFQSHMGQSAECLNCEDGPIQAPVTAAEEPGHALPLDDAKAIKALFEDVAKAHVEEKLQELLTAYSPFLPSSELLTESFGNERLPDSGMVPSREIMSHASDETTSSRDITSYLGLEVGGPVVIALSCLFASLALGCLIGMLYLKYMLSTGLSTVHLPWNDSSRIEQQEQNNTESAVQDSQHGSGDEKLGLLFLDVQAPEPVAVIVSAEDGTWDEKVNHIDAGFQNCANYSSDEEDLNEKFHDAIGSPSPFLHANPSLPRISVEYSDPDFLPLPLDSFSTPYSTPPHTPPRSALRRLPSQPSMREAASSSPLSRPAWSLRASDSPALGIATSPLMRAVTPEPISLHGSTVPLAIPGAFVPDEEKHIVERLAPRRAYRAPVPELDLAFAMQLRPGMGLGSDPAWLVRFLMAMFGWMTVLIGGNGTSGPTRRTITV